MSLTVAAPPAARKITYLAKTMQGIDLFLVLRLVLALVLFFLFFVFFLLLFFLFFLFLLLIYILIRIIRITISIGSRDFSQQLSQPSLEAPPVQASPNMIS